jgi:hypothetical protein
VVAIVDLLRHPKIEPYLQTDSSQPVDSDGQPIRNSNIFSGSVAQWMVEDVKRTSGDPDALPLYYSVFSDGTQWNRRRMMHGVKLCMMSVPEPLRNSYVSKYNLGFLSHPGGAPRTRASAKYKRGKGLLFSKQYDFLLDPLLKLQDEGFIFVRADGSRIRLVPRLLLAPTDVPEVTSMFRCFCVYNTPHPCPVCLARMGRGMWVANADGRSRFPWRTVQSMKDAIEVGNAKSFSIHDQPVGVLFQRFLTTLIFHSLWS